MLPFCDNAFCLLPLTTDNGTNFSFRSFSVSLIDSDLRLLIVFVVLQHYFENIFFYLMFNIHLYMCGCGSRCV